MRSGGESSESSRDFVINSGIAISLASSVLLSIVFFQSSANAAPAPPIVTYVDRSGGIAGAPRRWIILGSYPTQRLSNGTISVFGHAYVIFAREDPDSQSTRMEGYGFYPKDGSTLGLLKSVSLFPVQGEVVDSLKDSKFVWVVDTKRFLVVQVDELSYDKAIDHFYDFQAAPPPYHLLLSNCTTFVEGVAEAGGFPIPDSVSSLPDEAIRDLTYALTIPEAIDFGNEKYYGTVFNGLPYDSNGTATLPDGSTYRGSFINGFKTGAGTFRNTKGESTQGNFVNGSINGIGTVKFPDGTTYVGPLSNTAILRTASGSWQFPDGSTYSGVNLGHGIGSFTTALGTHYVGEVTDQQPDGTGTATFSDGRTMNGVFANERLVTGIFSARDGRREIIDTPTHATEYFPNGETIAGSYSNDDIQAGTITYPTGNTWSGPLSNGLPDGVGVFKWKSQYGRLNGRWTKGVPSPRMLYTSPDGRSVEVNMSPQGGISLPEGGEPPPDLDVSSQGTGGGPVISGTATPHSLR